MRSLQSACADGNRFFRFQRLATLVIAVSVQQVWAQTRQLTAARLSAEDRFVSSSSNSADLPNTPSTLLQTQAAASGEPAAAASADQPVSISGLPRRIMADEFHVLTSPARIRKADLVWLLPFAGAMAASFATDSRAMRDTVSKDSTLNAHAGTASDVLRDGFIGLPVAPVWHGTVCASGACSRSGTPRR